MPPAPRKNQLVHQVAADLYANGTVTTLTPLITLCELIAQQIEPTGATRPMRDSQRDAVLKLFKRLYPGGSRLRALWQALSDRALLDPSDPAALTMPDSEHGRLVREIEQGDPMFATVAATLDRARNTTDPAERETLLADAADLLTDLTPPDDEPLPDAGTPAAEDLREFYDKLNRLWVQVFELALGDTGKPSRSAFTLGRRAVHAGHLAVTRRRDLRTGQPTDWGEPGWAPRQLAVHMTRHGRWVAAAAVLETLQATGEHDGSSSLPDRILRRTRKVASRDLKVSFDELNESELLTQAGWTLLRAGRRHLASELAVAAWPATGKSADGHHRTVSPPDELLELGIELAGVQYAHGEHDAAAATLHPRLRATLLGPYPGPPDEDWGEVCSAVFFHQLLRTLTDANSGSNELRSEWVQALGPGWSTAYPSKWVLAAVTAESLATGGDTASAATVARMSRNLLEPPRTPAEEQLRAHLSEMCSSDPGPAAAGTANRVEALLDELVALVVREPDAVDHEARRMLHGLQELTALRYRRLRHQPDAA